MFYAWAGDFEKLHGCSLTPDIYKYSFPDICIFVRFKKKNCGLYFYIVPIPGFPSPSGGVDDALLLFSWFCKLAAIIFNNWIYNSWLLFRWYVKKCCWIVKVLWLLITFFETYLYVSCCNVILCWRYLHSKFVYYPFQFDII